MARGYKTGGRTRGTPNKATAAREAEIAASGKTPLEVMIEVMRFHHDEAQKLIARLTAGELPLPADDDAGADSPLVQALRQVVGMATLALDAAKAAAPYVHPRAALPASDDGDDEHVPLAERLAYYQRRDDIDAAGGKVVDLYPQ
jgi:hypothetical protein